ncbi:MAG: DUF4097 family beta strand repeat protein [Spirochaetales bacterium]|nr:DUF4097 family beta strand repeat protein [Spirochaetales bacterium]
MRSRRTWVDILGPILGIAAIGMVAFALFYLLSIRPFYRGGSYRSPQEASARRTLGGWVQEEGTESFEQAFERLEVRNVSGPVRIEGWRASGLEVSYVKRARSHDALEQFEVRLEPRGGTLVVQPVYGRPPSARFGPVDFTVRVPPSVRQIEVVNVSGGIVLENMSARVDQELESVSGSIETEMSGDLQAKSVSGEIRFSSAGSRLQVRTTSGGIRGEILSLEAGGEVNVESISGAVELEAFDGLDAAVTLQSVSGSVSCGFPLRIIEQRRNRLEGTIGEGSVPVLLKTVSGRIRLLPMDEG